MKKEKVLKKYFGHRKFRDGQSEIIDNILEGNDILGIMPTGAGNRSASVGCLSDTTSLKIISDDLCGRNDLKSKVSTLEELYDFFSKNTQKLHRMM